MFRRTKSHIICNALVQNVNRRLVCHFSYKTSRVKEQESFVTESLLLRNDLIRVPRTPALLSIKEGTSGGKTLETRLV